MSFTDRVRRGAQRAAAAGREIASDPSLRSDLVDASKTAIKPSLVPFRKTRVAGKAVKAIYRADQQAQQRGGAGAVSNDQFGSITPPPLPGGGNDYPPPPYEQYPPSLGRPPAGEEPPWIP